MENSMGKGTKKLIIGIAGFVVLASFLLGRASSPAVRVVKEEVEVCSELGRWKELKDTDDQIITILAESLDICSNSSIGYYDVDMTRLDFLVGAIATAKDNRLEVLRKLGY